MANFGLGLAPLIATLLVAFASFTTADYQYPSPVPPLVHKYRPTPVVIIDPNPTGWPGAGGDSVPRHTPVITTPTPWPQPTPGSGIYNPPPVHKYPPLVPKYRPTTQTGWPGAGGDSAPKHTPVHTTPTGWPGEGGDSATRPSGSYIPKPPTPDIVVHESPPVYSPPTLPYVYASPFPPPY